MLDTTRKMAIAVSPARASRRERAAWKARSTAAANRPETVASWPKAVSVRTAPRLSAA